MVICPDCGHENIAGADTCESCEQSLTALSKPQASTPLEKSVMRDRVEVLNPRTPVSVAPETPVGDVLDLLIDKKIGCVMVVQDDQLVGVFSERDALVRVNTEIDALADRPVSEFMTPSPDTLEINDKIAFAIHKMALGNYRHVPIVTDGKPTGMISIRDILRYTTEKLATAEA